jgi:hypothetical protein
MLEKKKKLSSNISRGNFAEQIGKTGAETGRNRKEIGTTREDMEIKRIKYLYLLYRKGNN